MAAKSRRKVAAFVVVTIAAAAGLGAAYRYWNEAPPDYLTLYGNVDIRQVDLAFNDTGRLEKMFKEEGDPVKEGEVLARMETDTYKDLVSLAQARTDAQRDVVNKLVAGSRPEEIARDRAQVEADKATLVNAQRVLKRRTELLARGNVSQQLYDDAKTAVDEASAHLDLSKQVLALTVIGPRQEDIDAAKAQLRADEATLALAQRRLADTELKAPADGVVLSRIVEPGAMVGPTNPIYTITLTDKVWVRTYVPETALGDVHPGATVEVTNDTRPNHIYQGWIGFVSPTAEFTPKTVETPELRTQLVYRLRVFIRNPDQGLRQGMPVTVRVPLHQPAQAGPKTP